MIQTIRWRQAGAFGVLLLGLLAAGFLGTGALRGLSQDVSAGISQAREVADLGSQLQRDVLELIFAGDGYVATGDQDAKQRFSQLAGRTQDVAKSYRELEGLSLDEVRLIEQLTASLTQLEVEFARAHALYDIGQRAQARQAADAGQPLAEEVAGLISALAEQQALNLETQAATLRRRAGERSGMLWGILIAALGAGAALAFLTIRSIDRPLAQLLAATRRLQSGDLNSRVGKTDKMPREFAAVALAFDAMAAAMSHIASRVSTTASQLSSSAGDFSAISEQVAGSTHEVALAMTEISDGADRQSHALNETAAAVVELREGAASIEEQARRNRELSHTISEQAGNSQESVRQAVDLLLSLREVVHSSAEELEGLVAVTDQITGFVKRIASIAEQTHLLSLNAAIEAAHAGHEGRGFSVVAEEVGKLAAEADGAAKEVDEVVSQLREWVGTTAVKMQEGEGQVVHVEGVARGAQEALDTIAAGLTRVSKATDQALATVERSHTLLEQVAGHVETVTATASSHAARSQDVSAAVQEQSATTQQITASVSELVATAEDLRLAVGEWQV